MFDCGFKFIYTLKDFATAILILTIQRILKVLNSFYSIVQLLFRPGLGFPSSYCSQKYSSIMRACLYPKNYYWFSNIQKRLITIKTVVKPLIYSPRKVTVPLH